MKTNLSPALVLLLALSFSACTDKLLSASDAPTPETSPSSETLAAPT